ncbi:MAG: hypothetical protein HQL87_12625 [Magnetococcales bacterium]|nr:hypothetical protein [Magnetococcales bacterium]
MFEPLYYKDKLQIINPQGDIGVVTLWSPVKTVYKKLSTHGIDLDPHTSRIAALGTLYGNGLPELLHNLLYNPQIAYLVILGKDLANARQELIGFFARGLEETTYLGTPMYRIIGTDKKMDGSVKPEDFRTRPLTVTDLSVHREPELAAALQSYFAERPPQQPCQAERVRRTIPQPVVQWYPSHPGGHSLMRHTPLEAWQEVIFRLVRFGHRQQLRKGERIELQNMKVIIQEPAEEDPVPLAKWGFALADLHAYQATLLDPTPSAEQPYTYGNRLRGYFQSGTGVIDTLETAICHLREDAESRRAYIALWDSNRDTLPITRGHPCLVALFFRKWAGQLTLTATFRTHNALDGWLRNVYGLMAVQRYVADRVPLPVGSLTIISHSISIDPQGNGLARAQAIALAKKSDDRVDLATGKRSLRMDPNGELLLSTDDDTQEIVVQHLYQGRLLKEYRAKEPETLEKMLARDCALSEISHALYLGREMARCEIKLKKNHVKFAHSPLPPENDPT